MILVAGALALAAPTAIAESQLGAAPESGAEPGAKATRDRPHRPQEDTTAATPEPTPQARVDGMATPPPEPGGAVEPEQTPEPDAGAAPESGAEPGARATPDRPHRPHGPHGPQEDTTAATPEPSPQAPASPSQSTGNSGAPCFLTSAGLICPGNPDCILTSAGVSCASGCTVTSAGISCPSGGEVPPGRPVPGPPKQTRRRSPAIEVKSERKAKTEGKVSPTTVAPVDETGGLLPFTGAPMLMWLVLGFALWAGGLLLRRMTSTASPAVELSTAAQPLAVLPGPSRRAPKPPSRWAIVLPSLALMACGMLLFNRRRR